MTKRRTFRRLLRLAIPAWRAMLLAALTGTATIASSIGLLATSAYIIATAALQPSIAVLQTAIVGVRVFGLSRGFLRYAERLQSHQATFQVLARLRTWFFEQLEPLAPAGLVDHHGGDLLARHIGDVQSLEDFYVRTLAPPLAALFTSLGLMTIYAGVSIPLAAVTFLCLMIGGVIIPWLSSLEPFGAQRLSLRAQRESLLLEAMVGAAEIAANNRIRSRLERLDRVSQIDMQLERKQVAIRGLGHAFMVFLKAAAVTLGLLIAIPMVIQGQLDGVYLSVISLATLASFEAVAPLPEAFQHLRQHLGAAQRLFAVADQQPEVIDPPRPATPPDDTGIEIERLTFRYAPDRMPALQDVSLSIPGGSLTALLGPSGSGKSTIANLLLRLWDVDAGHIRLGGVDLRKLRQDDVRELCSVVPQRVELFYGTIRDNLLLANPDAGEGDIQQAVKLAQLDPVLAGLPDGLDTILGEGGATMSGGERQRIALARAFLKPAPLLILDEPGTHLDEAIQAKVMEGILSLHKRRTILWITHRLTNMKEMDQVYVLSEGRIAQHGRHADLVSQDGIYARMWALEQQALDIIPSST